MTALPVKEDSFQIMEAASSSCDIPSEAGSEIRRKPMTSEQKESLSIPRIPHGIVISGEASESDEEIDTNQILPKSSSDFSISESWGRSSAEPSEKSDLPKENAVKYNSLLHKKLREKNQTLRRNMIDLVTQPYESATKEIHTISQQLIKSQLLVQELRTTIRRLTNDLFDMEDKMETLRSGSFLPDIYDFPPSDSP